MSKNINKLNIKPMKKRLLLVIATLFATVSGIYAESYKIGPSSATGMDFESINAAMKSGTVKDGDILYLDNTYVDTEVEQTITKSVTIYGNGYDTSNSRVANLGIVNVKADNVRLCGIKLNQVSVFNNETTVERCYVSSAVAVMTAGLKGFTHVHACYIRDIRGVNADNPSQIDAQNNISFGIFQYLINSTILHNTMTYSAGSHCLIESVKNTEIRNNILFNNYNSNNHCVQQIEPSDGNIITNNIINYSSSYTFYPNNKFNSICSYQKTTFDDYRLKAGSPAQGYANDGTDCGAFAGLYPYVIGGRPIYTPYFSDVKVPTQATDGQLQISVTVKVQNE